MRENQQVTEHTVVMQVLKPFIVAVYGHANLTIPATFDVETEVERVVTALRVQGFNTQFPVVRG